jgi:hypothetical protein
MQGGQAGARLAQLLEVPVSGGELAFLVEREAEQEAALLEAEPATAAG